MDSIGKEYSPSIRNGGIHQQRFMRVICIGAGASGLCFAYKLQRSFENFSLTIFEKNADVSGTWFENRYPGVACDYPAHNYTYTFEPKPDWSGVYASGPEIRGYFTDFKVKYGLGKYCKLLHEVTRASWNNEIGEWTISVKNLEHGTEVEYSADILVNAGGVLNSWKWPEISGIHHFEGTLVHSAAWNESIDLTGKKVGLIGNGSSGMQIMAAIHPIVKNLTTFVRQPNWIFGPFGSDPRKYSQEELTMFREKPETLREIRKKNEIRINSFFGTCLSGSDEQNAVKKHIEAEMRKKIGNSEYEEQLIPKWGVGCRRPTPGVGYLEALKSENVHLVPGEIQEITATGIRSGGRDYELDIILCATGFNTSYIPRFPIIGLDGVNLQELWAVEPQGYLAVAVPKIPNYFVFYGPNNPFASGPYLPTAEAQADYMLKVCDRWQTENIHSFAPKTEAMNDFTEHASKILQKTVWAEDCRSWYKRNGTDQSSLTIWPGSGLHYTEAIADVRGDDWDIVYKGNRFSWLGNGFSQTELDPDADLAYYVREDDDGPMLSRHKRRKLLTRKSDVL